MAKGPAERLKNQDFFLRKGLRNRREMPEATGTPEPELFEERKTTDNKKG
ncbi:hypothetical protein [Pseudomonas sp. RC10]